MNPKILAGGAGVALVAFAAVYFWYNQSTAHLTGQIYRVSVIGMDQEASAAVVHFKLVNPSNREFWVRDRQIRVSTEDGRTLSGRVFKMRDLDKLYKYFPALGTRVDALFKHGVTVPSGESEMYVVGARFEVPKHVLDARGSMTLRIGAESGRYSEIHE